MNQTLTSSISTREQLLLDIDECLLANPDLSEESFGWFSVKQPWLIQRLRDGGDVSTKTLDLINAYMKNPIKKEARDGKDKKRKTRKAKD